MCLQKLVEVAQSDVTSNLNVRPRSQLPSRSSILKSLEETEEFDVLVIGGGATGAGVALDSQTRGIFRPVHQHQKYRAIIQGSNCIRNRISTQDHINCVHTGIQLMTSASSIP